MSPGLPGKPRKTAHYQQQSVLTMTFLGAGGGGEMTIVYTRHNVNLYDPDNILCN